MVLVTAAQVRKAAVEAGIAQVVGEYFDGSDGRHGDYEMYFGRDSWYEVRRVPCEVAGVGVVWQHRVFYAEGAGMFCEEGSRDAFEVSWEGIADRINKRPAWGAEWGLLVTGQVNACGGGLLTKKQGGRRNV